MKLYHIKRLDRVYYDEFDSFVVRAEDETAARKLAASKEDIDSKESWLDERLSDCTELTSEGDATIILGSYNAG